MKVAHGASERALEEDESSGAPGCRDKLVFLAPVGLLDGPERRLGARLAANNDLHAVLADGEGSGRLQADGTRTRLIPS